MYKKASTFSNVWGRTVFFLTLLVSSFLVACSSPILGKQVKSGNADFTLNFIVSGSQAGARDLGAAGTSRILLPNASTLEVSLTPLTAGAAEGQKQTVTLGADSVVSVGFSAVAFGDYTLHADAKNGAGIILFTQESTLTIGAKNIQATLNMVPVNSDAITVLSDQSKTSALPAGTSITWLVPADSELMAGSRGKITPASPNVLYFVQTTDGKLLAQGSADGTIDTTSLPPNTAFFFTVYNKPESAVYSFTYTLYHLITYVSDGAIGSVPMDPTEYLKGNPATVLGPGSLIGPVIRDGISQYLIGWYSPADGGMSCSVGTTITMGTANLTMHPIWSTGTDVLGKIGPAGGKVFYDKTNYADGWRYLEAAPFDQAPLSNIVMWSSENAVAVNGTSAAVGAGSINTLAMIHQAGYSSAIPNAASVCTSLEIMVNGINYDDWFLPSSDELGLIATNLIASRLNGSRTTNAMDWDYWSSTEFDATTASEWYFQDLSPHSTTFTADKPKTTALVVRAIRAFSSAGIQTYSLAYDPNGAPSGSPPTETRHRNRDAVTVIGNTGNLSNTGSFKGWNTAADGSGTNYTQGDVLYVGASNVTLYAQWNPTIYALCDTGPAGGLIFYINPSFATDGWRYMEAAPSDTSAGIIWGTAAQLLPYAVGAGKANSATMNAAGYGGAAALCENLVVGAFSDWYLPSDDEVYLMYQNLCVPLGGAGFNAASVYWSSTAWNDGVWRGITTYFTDGTEIANPIDFNCRVRAARRF